MSPAQAAAAAVQSTVNQPNLFELSGDGIQVTYSTTSFDGKARFDYHDAQQSKVFVGDQIRTLQTEIGTLVSVTIRMTVDAGSTSFSLLIPTVNLRVSNSAQVHTIGITTLHKLSIVGGLQGQTETYTVHPLHGTGSFVQF
jgi:hypothetical protein